MSKCECQSRGVVPLSLIRGHCEGHTKTFPANPTNAWLCQDCLWEILMDSQWSVGWKRRASFLFQDVTSRYWEARDRRGDIKEASQYQEIMTSGTAALSSMCIKCSHSNDISDMREKDLPDFLKQANKRWKEKYLPSSEHDQFGNLICKDCAVIYEKKFIQQIRPIDLPLHINDEWLTEKGREFYLNRIKG